MERCKETNKIIQIEPGIYSDISNEDYHNGPAISRSGILEFKQSPAHFYSKYLDPNGKPQKSSPAKELGASFHPYILEPDLFNRDFVYEDKKIDGRSAEGKLYRKEFKEKNESKKILTYDQYSSLLGMAKALKNNLISFELIKNALYEQTIYWIDDNTGILCKCRPDILHIKANIICDLKSTDNAKPSNFQYSVKKYGYHIQAAMMCDGFFKTFGRKIEEFIFICVESSPPYCVSTLILSETSINEGKEEYKNILKKYKECFEKNEWPGYEELQTISLPEYRRTE